MVVYYSDICVGTQECQITDERQKEDEQVRCVHTYHGCAVGLKDSTWKKVEVIFLVSHNNGVACIVPTLNINFTLLKRLIRSCKNKPGLSPVQLKTADTISYLKEYHSYTRIPEATRVLTCQINPSVCLPIVRTRHISYVYAIALTMFSTFKIAS